MKQKPYKGWPLSFFTDRFDILTSSNLCGFCYLEPNKEGSRCDGRPGKHGWVRGRAQKNSVKEGCGHQVGEPRGRGSPPWWLPEEVVRPEAGGNANITVIRGTVGWAINGGFDVVNLAGGQAALTSAVLWL